MRVINYILLLILPFFLSAHSLTDEMSKEILKEFDIPYNNENMELIRSISLGIDHIDKRSFKTILEDKIHHASMIKNELEVINAPEFLLYLAMKESRLSNSATSSVKAGGIWQFMPKTAKVFGLTIDNYVDERRDPYASTDAAFRYMNFLYGNFNKWYLSIMAYNCGDGCIKKAIRTTGSDSITTLLNSRSVPRETKNFIKDIIKFSIIAREDEIKKIIDSSKSQVHLSKISVKPGTKLSTIGNSIGIDEKTMKEYNAHIKTDIAPKYNKNYYFYIPTDKLSLYSINIATSKISKGMLKADKSKIHIVKEGETLSQIASNLGVEESEIIKINNLKDGNVKPNQKLEIPSKNTALIDAKKYRVKNGDSLAKISDKFNVTVKQILVANNLKDTKITAGETIVIP